MRKPVLDLMGMLPSLRSTTGHAQTAVLERLRGNGVRGSAATQACRRQSHGLLEHDEVFCTSPALARVAMEHAMPLLSGVTPLGGDLCWLSFLLHHPPHALHLALRLLVEQMTLVAPHEAR